MTIKLPAINFAFHRIMATPPLISRQCSAELAGRPIPKGSSSNWHERPGDNADERRESSNGSENMPVPPLITSLFPISWRCDGTPGNHSGVDGLVAEPCDEASGNEKRCAGQKQVERGRAGTNK